MAVRGFFWFPETASFAVSPLDIDFTSYTERHAIMLDISAMTVQPLAGRMPGPDDLREASHIFIVLPNGWISKTIIKTLRRFKNSHQCYLYWPDEGALEKVDDLHFNSLRRLQVFQRWRSRLKLIKNIVVGLLIIPLLPVWAALSVLELIFAVPRRYLEQLLSRHVFRYRTLGYRHWFLKFKYLVKSVWVPFSIRIFLFRAQFQRRRKKANPGRNAVGLIRGHGVYVRTDFWAKITSGGSYGHTCHQAAALAKTVEDFTVITASEFSLLNELGVSSLVLDPQCAESSEVTILRANKYFYEALGKRFTEQPPAFIYERLVLGNYAAARLAEERGIPYLVEYNGSEIVMKRSYDTKGYDHEKLFEDIELYQFRCADAIYVVSDVIRQDLIARGISGEKIYVNWNAVSPEHYKPLRSRKTLRKSLGFDDSHCVVCFVGTYGGWHGIAELCAAIPQIAKGNKKIRFLMIGDGNLKPMLNQMVENSGLESVVVDMGRLPQNETARIMAAADIFVAPHAGHMKGSKFFGSPTKLFEYLSMGRATIASRLEQMEEIMMPSVDITDLSKASQIGDNIGVLIEPGSVDQLVEATLILSKKSKWIEAMGQNARNRVLAEYSWDRHVEKIWQFLDRQQISGGQ